MGMLEGNVTIVTGGGSGIGKGIVERFVAEGALVVAVDRVGDRVTALQDLHPGKVLGVQADISTYEGNALAVTEAVRAFGKLDTFIGNAGLWDFGISMADTPPDKLASSFDELFAVNVKGYLLGAKAALPELQKTDGCIIYTLSNAAFWPAGGGPIYTASKHAVTGLIRQLAFELYPAIRVNGVAPGGTVTDLRGLSAMGMDNRSFGDMIKAIQAADTEGRFKMADPSEHAGVYAFLASRENSPQTTGEVIDSTGSMLIRLFKMAMPARS